MAKAIFFNIPASGHINPTLPVMRLLADSDIEIVYVNAENTRTAIEATGVRFVAYPADAKQFHDFFADIPFDNFASNAVNLLKIGNELLPFCLKLIEEEQPDFIIHDSLASWAKVAAQVAGLRRLAFFATFVVSGNAGLDFPIRYIALFAWQMLQALQSYASEAIKMRRIYKTTLAFPDLLTALADDNIVFTTEQFQPSIATNERYAFVGASVGARPQNIEFPFELLRDDVPLVYISLGTIAKNNEFLQQCFTAFADMKAQFILSVGKQTDIASLGTIPNNFLVRNFVPQLDILRRVDAFITHGGLNSVHEGFLNGVPLVVVPQQAEQGMVAKQVVANGAGLGLQMQPPYGKVTAHELYDILKTILDNPSYAENSAKMGDVLRGAGGAPRVAELVQQFAAHGKLLV